MKRRLTGYTFDASAQTIVHDDFSVVGLNGIQLITNVTDGVIIYQFNSPSKGGSLATDTLTLTFDTTSMSDTDDLMILVEDGAASVAINDGGNTITVDGTVTANLSATDNAVLDDIAADTESIKTAVETLDNAIAGSEMQVDVVGALPAGNNNIGDVDIASSVLPSGASTSANQTTIIGHLDGVEGVLGTIDTDTGNIATNTTDLPNVIGTDGAAGPSKAVSVAGTDGSGNLQEISTNTSGHVNIADGGNVITVDGTVGVSGTVTVDGSGVTQPVSNAGLTELAAAINGSSQMDVNLAANGIGLATSAKQDTIIGHVDGIEGLLTTIDSDTSTLAATDFATEAKQDDIITAIEAIPGGGGVQYTEGDTDGSITGTAMMFESDTGTDELAVVSTVTPLPVSLQGNVDIASIVAPVAVTDNSSSLSVDWNGTQPVTGSGNATGALRVELANNGTGLVGLNAGTNGIGKLTANSGVDIGDVDVTSVIPSTGATNLGKAEDAGHSTGNVGVFSLGVRNDTMADVTDTDADYSQISTDLKGRVLTTNAPRARKLHQITTITSSTGETTVLTAAASTYHDVYGVMVTNTSATATEVHFKDDTGGTTRFTLSVPANDMRGFMLPVDAAIPASATNDNWTATCADSVASIIITVLAVKNL